jgi:hypothetical protein
MIETKAESQDYLADPYSNDNSLGPLLFEYVIQYYLSVFFPCHAIAGFFSASYVLSVTCQTATRAVPFSIDRSHPPPRPLPAWIILPPRFINSPFPMH